MSLIDKHGRWGNISTSDAGSEQKGKGGVVPPGEPPHDGGMEARVAKLEATAEHMREDIRDIKADLRSIRDNARTDFRLLFGALITVALGLAAIMAHGFKWI